MTSYHLRRKEKALDDPAVIDEILARVRLMTVACCEGNVPYLFTVDYVWDPAGRSLWFHCAAEGRKNAVMAANPQVCVTVVDDRGYIDGECEHHYRSLVMEGKAVIVTDPIEKLHGLELLVRRHESTPDKVRETFVNDEAAIRKVGMVRIDVTEICGKQSPVAKA